MTSRAARLLVLALLLLGAGAGGWVLGRATGPGAQRPAAGGAARGPAPILVAERRAAPDELMEDLAALGYADTYERAGAEGGVVLHDPARSQPGWNLVVSTHGPVAVLTDMEGHALHEWRHPASAIQGWGTDREGSWRRARLLPGGDLLAIFDGVGLIRLDQRSQLRWALRGGYHHDLAVAPDGTILVLDRETRILEEFDRTRPTVEDFVTTVGPDGQVLGRLSLVRAFQDSEYAPLLVRASAGGDIFHTNTLELLDGSQAHVSPHFAAGNLLVSIWGLDVIAVVDPRVGRVVWALTGKWHRQHEPTLLEGGNVLLFDNLGLGEHSRVLEVRPFDQTIVWAYEGDEANGFYSQVLGSAARLPNGNTLITESQAATAFEVTPEGEQVWRYVNPYRFEPDEGDLPVLMEVVRLGPEAVEGWLER